MSIWILVGLFALYLLCRGTREYFDEKVLMNPTYLQETTYPEEIQYTQGVIQKQENEIRRLRTQVKKLAEMIDDGETDSPTEKFYRRKLSNKYYKIAPYLSAPADDYLNLHDDDFSTKTLSTIKFLSQTRSSNFYGSEVHFPTELCDNFCETEDRNAARHEQIDLVRPIKQTGYIPSAK